MIQDRTSPVPERVVNPQSEEAIRPQIAILNIPPFGNKPISTFKPHPSFLKGYTGNKYNLTWDILSNPCVPEGLKITLRRILDSNEYKACSF